MWISIPITILIGMVGLIFIIQSFLLHKEQMADKEIELIKVQAEIERYRSGDLDFKE